jgi:hypothetical protein
MRILLSSGEVSIPSNEEPFVVRCAPSWEATVDLLRDEVEKHSTAITHLEIHCHGLPAVLKMCQTIDHQNIESFAAALNTVMSPWGYIELLACLVAQHPINRLGGVERAMIEAKNQIFSLDGALMKAATADNEYILRDQLPSEISSLPPSTISEAAALSYFRPIFDSAYGAKHGGTNPPESTYESKEFLFDERRAAEKTAKVTKGFSSDQINASQRLLQKALLTKDFGQKGNGLDFCLRMALASQCIVRASEVPQTEGGYDNSAFDTFGDWEGRVWDFMPDGSITYLGYCLSRLGTPYPAQWSGSLATV